ncbi:B/F/G family RNA polymerase sigma-70 factor [Streptomyces sp. SA15]|uniref:RNA polymerase sigma factor SigF n=1 Tax=Streptomyces sp. SA15 TaxID=934019 RepID=UPI000BAF3D21|nr:RNA polymerase sigma factor SigF [Streptomyces sp. SA15]PAZ11390.1 B/F/G family RNA polymerase sigma-70 factor [Streptomyces sp. SA15]
MATATTGNPVRTISYAERHTTGPGAAHAVVPGLEDLPPLPDPAHVDAADARALSKTLFARLDSLEEGTPEYSYVRNSLVELNLALVRFAAGRMGVRGESYDDVIQVGTIGLIKAINRFDLHRGVEFPTFAMPTIIGEIKRHFRDSSWAVHVPRRLQELRLDLTKAVTHLEQTHGRAPTVPELARHLDLDEDEVVEGLVAANGYTTSSLDYPSDTESPEDTLADHIGYTDPDLAKVEDLHALKPLIAALPARERKILALRYGADMTQSAIGKELGISQMHVSRILNRTLARLRTKLVGRR